MSRQPTEVRRRQIGEAALRVISRDGLGRFTTAAIAGEVGLTEGALFRHVGSKADIVAAAVDVLEEVLAGTPPPQAGDPIEQLGAFFRRRVELIQSNPGMFRILFSDQLLQAASPEIEARILRLQERSLTFVRARLQEASDQGLLAPGLGVAEVFTLVHGAALALAFAGARRPSSAPVADPHRVWTTLESILRR